jgi:hypothetical protein
MELSAACSVTSQKATQWNQIFLLLDTQLKYRSVSKNHQIKTQLFVLLVLFIHK